MAIFMDDNRFNCECGHVQFKMIEIKSFQKVVSKEQQILIEDYNKPILECINCHKTYDLDDMNINLMLKE